MKNNGKDTRRFLSSSIKRTFDLLVSAPIFVMTLPIQAATAAAVLASMGAPVLFRQQRPGLDGKPFELMKFRSMHGVDASKGRVDDSSRLTRVGKFIRSTSLDELPTLLNIIKGDMSLVGPRPLRMKYLDRYSPEQARRNTVKPGMTGLAQVNGRNGISWEERFAWDTYYVDHKSFLLDLKILIKTVHVVLSREGVTEQGQVTMTEFLGSTEESQLDTKIEPSKLPAGITSDIRRLIAEVLGGKDLKRQAKEIENALQNPDNVPRKEQIDTLVRYAAEHVPFYQDLEGVGFEDLPVVNKQIIKSDVSQFLSDEFEISQLASSSTSGSTGVPFTVYFDEAKSRRHRAGLLGTYRFLGLDPYAPLVHSRSWPKATVKTKVLQTLKEHFTNSRITYSESSVDEILNWIGRRKGVGLMGYTSMTESLMRELETRVDSIPYGTVAAVIGGSEPATDYLVQGAKRLFGVEARMRYSNMEMGIIGVTGENIDTYHLDGSSFLIEILQESSDSPVEPGEQGRIVITDLYNRAMPLIRYDTGDLGRHPLSVRGKENKGLITDVKGRRLDVLIAGTEASPRRLHPMAIWGPLAKIGELNQFQLRQLGVGRFKWVLNGRKDAVIESKLRGILDERIGDILECNFSYVEEVPVLASGKRQFFVTEIEDPEKYFVKSN